MAYGIKFELFFSDKNNRRLKVEILQKDFTGTGLKWEDISTNFEATENLWNDQTESITGLIGTEEPVKIEWDGDDDIYSPIIGSRCILNLYVTDTTSYDEFYTADEREYIVKVLYYTPSGSNWENTEPQWEQFDQVYEAGFGEDIFYQPMWVGFLVVDRFQEQVLSKPYPITLEAIDGLGTLEGFETPFDASDTNATQNLFYSLKEILKLTGHEHQIYIANDTRKVGGATNDTIFHDISVSKYAFMNQNLIFKNAKETLVSILKATNSRIFHSYGRWYIVNNSSLIDNRVNQLTIAPSGDDTAIEPATPVDPTEVISTPVMTIQGKASVEEGTMFSFFGQITNNSGSAPTSFTWTLPDGSTQSGTGPLPQIQFLATLSMNGQTIALSVLNSAGTGTVTNSPLTLGVTSPSTPTGGDVGGHIQIIANTDNLTNSTVSPQFQLQNFLAGEVGNSYSMDFLVTPNAAYSLGSINDITVSGLSGTVTKTLSGSNININITGTLPSQGFIETMTIIGGVDNTLFYIFKLNVVNNSTNTQIFAENSPSVATSLTFEKQLVIGTVFDTKIRVVADANFVFPSIDKIDATLTTGSKVKRVTSLVKAENSISGRDEIIVIAEPISFNDLLQGGSTIEDILTITGGPINNVFATSLDITETDPTNIGTITVPNTTGYLRLIDILGVGTGINNAFANGLIAISIENAKRHHNNISDTPFGNVLYPFIEVVNQNTIVSKDCSIQSVSGSGGKSCAFILDGSGDSRNIHIKYNKIEEFTVRGRFTADIVIRSGVSGTLLAKIPFQQFIGTTTSAP
tara:strand:- start:7260 stop:9665 length:2406 start_codon:yes stop_codon:yes gene_type:complete